MSPSFGQGALRQHDAAGHIRGTGLQLGSKLHTGFQEGERNDAFYLSAPYVLRGPLKSDETIKREEEEAAQQAELEKSREEAENFTPESTMFDEAEEFVSAHHDA